MWADNTCINASSLGTINTTVCQSKVFRTDYNADLGFTIGDITCDDKGQCGYSVDCTNEDNLDSGKCPTCIIPSGYCNSKGLDYESVNGLGDCDESDVQAIFEAILGKTIVRTFKRNFQNMQKECAHSTSGFNCAKAVLTFELTGVEIAAKTAQKIADDLVSDLKKKCSGDFTKSTSDFLGCANAILRFNPYFYATELGIKMADGMLNFLLGWTGMPKNVLSRGVGYMVKYGVVAVTAVFHFGEKAIKAIDKAGHMCIAALDKIGLGPLAEFTDIGMAVQALDLIMQFGPEAAGVAVVHAATQEAEQVIKVVNCAIGAVLHPEQFAKHLWSSIKSGKIFEDAVVAALKQLKIAKQLGKAALHLFLAGVKIAGKVLQHVWDAVKKAAEELAHDLEEAAEAVGHFFSSIF
jgi:hypothetical protein